MATSAHHAGDVSIIDIRRSEIPFSILDEMVSKLHPAPGLEKSMPTMLLYDEQGLKLFEDITYLEEYYLTNAEIEVLERYADNIAERIRAGSWLVELGSGNLRKVRIFLEAIERARKDVDYYALDLSRLELQRTLSAVPPGTFKHVSCQGLLGTYEDGLEWLKSLKTSRKPTCIMSLGSSIGNFGRQEAAEFLKGFASILGSGDFMMIGIDGCLDASKVYRAYNDEAGLTHKFYRNGLTQANRLLGKEAFRQRDWNIIGEYDTTAGRHQAFFVPVRACQIDDVFFPAGKGVLVEQAHKYSSINVEQLWDAAGLHEGAVYGDRTGQYNIHLVSPAKFSFPLKPEQYAPSPVPSLQEFEQLWTAWDLVTRWMIPQEELLSKPIKLRNCYLFYLGHIPNFLDVQLTRASDGIPTKPGYNIIFDRGIDPDVDNPELCHAHSEIPDSWPSVQEIVTFQKRVRERARSLYKIQATEINRKLGRALWISFEHEAMHLETLLYMLLQSDKTVPPPGVTPDFVALADQATSHQVPNQWVKIPASEITIGLNDPENDEGPDRYLGWDNEKAARKVHVGAFESKSRGLTNADYALYLTNTSKDKIPASWTTTTTDGHHDTRGSATLNSFNQSNIYMNGESKPLTDAFLKGKVVRTVYGHVPLASALDWPVMASYDELAGCAMWMGGRIMKVEEARSLYNYVDQLKAKDSSGVSAHTIPAVNGHLSNEGVEETPPLQPCHQNCSGTGQSLDPKSLFVNLEGCNIGFKHFHPVPITQNGNKLSGQAEMGGCWEWTSSVLEKHQGFEAMRLYPAYTADFFDGKHNIAVGGSWATHPRIAGRRTFVNWYQRKYLYAWAGARYSKYWTFNKPN